MKRPALCLLGVAVITSFWTFRQAHAQETTTNVSQLAQQLSKRDWLYSPVLPWECQAYPTDGQPWWTDFSQFPNEFSPPATVALPEVYGVKLLPLRLTCNLLTGETIVRAEWSGEAIACIAPPADYQPGEAAAQDEIVLRMWQQWKKSAEEWDGEIDPFTLVLLVQLANINDKPVYDANVAAEEAAWEEAEAKAAEEFAAAEDGGGMLMDDSGGDPCVITNETAPFSIVSVTMGGTGCTLTWTSCSDHVYVLQGESSLTPTSSWTDIAWMWGTDLTTTFLDTNAVGKTQGFYRVIRGNPNTLNNGIPYGWAVDNGLDPLDPNLAWEDPDGDGFTNWQEYQAGTNPLDPNSHPNSMLIIPNASAVYVSSNSVQISADVRSTNVTVNVKAAEYFLDAIAGTNGVGTAMSAADGAFNSTNEAAVATFTPAFPYGERHVIYLHAEGQDGHWTPFKQVVLNPNVNDILSKIQANYSAMQDLQFTMTTTETQNGTIVSTNSYSVWMKGPYKTRSQYPDGSVSIRNENQYGWYNLTEGVGDVFLQGLNGDFSTQGTRSSDFFWDVPLATTRTDPSISTSVNSATFGLGFAPKPNVSWFVEHSTVDHTKGFVTEIDMTVEDVTTTSEYLNPVEILPGKWMFTTHRYTITLSTGDNLVNESTITNLQVNQGLADSLFTFPTQ